MRQCVRGGKDFLAKWKNPVAAAGTMETVRPGTMNWRIAWWSGLGAAALLLTIGGRGFSRCLQLRLLEPRRRSSSASVAVGRDNSWSRTAEWRRWHADPRSGQESQLAAIVEREHTASAGNDVDDEIGMFPDLELRGADINRGAADMTEQYVGVADDESVLRITHRRRPIAAPSRLMKQDRAVLCDDFFDEPKRRRCR